MNNKVVLITGAKGGLGSFVTQRFLATGATVVGTSRSISQADFPEANFVALPVDFTKAGAAGRAVESVVSRFVRLDRSSICWAVSPAGRPWRRPMMLPGSRCATLT